MIGTSGKAAEMGHLGASVETEKKWAESHVLLLRCGWACMWRCLVVSGSLRSITWAQSRRQNCNLAATLGEGRQTEVRGRESRPLRNASKGARNHGSK